jgi:hypothetical protein
VGKLPSRYPPAGALLLVDPLHPIPLAPTNGPTSQRAPWTFKFIQDSDGASGSWGLHGERGEQIDSLARFWALKNDGQLPSSLMHDSLSPTGYRLKPCTPRRIRVSRAQIRSYTLGIRPFASWSRSPRHTQIHCPATSHPLPEVRRPSATKGTPVVYGDFPYF